MGESNGDWGYLAESNGDEANLWDTYSPLPEAGSHALLDAFVESKNISIESLVRIGTRIDGDTLVFAYPGGLKYRDMFTGRRWSSLGASFDKLKIVRANSKPATICLVAEGETDAARLTLGYGVDVAVLPAGARGFASSHAEQLREFEHVIVATDSDEAGEAGAEKILSHLPHAVRLAPPRKDWCETPDDELPELPPQPTTRRIRLPFTDLDELLGGNALLVQPLQDRLIMPDSINMFTGHPASGKTTLVMHQCIKEMQEGRHVIWLDWENGKQSIRLRIEALATGFGKSALELVGDKLHYLPFGHIPADAEGEGFKLLAEAIEEFVDPIIVFDSMSKALMQNGLDEYSNPEVTKWNTRISIPARQAGATVVIIDHVDKKATRNQPYSRGAGAKLADTDVQWYVEVDEPFDMATPGKLLLTRHKDREGVLARQLSFSIGDGMGGLPIERTELQEKEPE